MSVLIPDEIKEICRKCEYNIHCQNKGCAFRSLGNDYCDSVINSTMLYINLQQRIDKVLDFIETWKKEEVFKVSMIDLYQIEEWLLGGKE